MAIFDRIRRGRSSERSLHAEPPPVPAHLLPDVNQRVTLGMEHQVPVTTRIEDIGNGMLELALPALPLEFADQVVVSWERDDAWFSMETHVLGVDRHATVPTVRLAAAGRLSRYDERRVDVRCSVSLPLALRVVRARAIRQGRELNTHTVELGGASVRFATTAPFAPGDVLEATLQLGESTADAVSARVRVIRVDAVDGSWRSTCTVAFEEILRSDRARLIAFADAARTRAGHGYVGGDGSTSVDVAPPTLDGVGGRDEPHDLGTLDNVVEWLRRRG